MKKGNTVVPLSPKTGKQIKRPRKGQKVIYAVKGIRGGLTVIRKEPQIYYKTDVVGLSRLVESTPNKNFIVYEQKLRTLERDSKGKIQYRVDKSGTRHKLYQTKITFAKPKRKQKPVLYAKGKKLRYLDIGHKTGNYAKVKQMRNLVILKPNTTVHEQVLQGRTLLEAISNIQLDINMKTVKKYGFGLYYNVFMIIDTEDGARVKVPVNGSFRDSEFQGTNRIGGVLYGRSEIKILANLHTKMSRSMRYALKNAGDGYTFTSLAMLDNIKKRQLVLVKKAEQAGEKDKADKLYSSIDTLYFGAGNRKRYFINKRTKLNVLKGKNQVTLFVKFEMMYE